MNNPADLRIIAAWLAKLADLTVTSRDDRRAMGDKLALYATMLDAEFPVGAFTQRSLAAVALECRFWPAYGELAKPLTAWWRDNRPHPVALPAPPSEPERGERNAEAVAHVRDVVAALRGDVQARARPVTGSAAGHHTKPVHPDVLARLRAQLGSAAPRMSA